MRSEAGGDERVGTAPDIFERRIDAGADGADRAQFIDQSNRLGETFGEGGAKPRLVVQVLTREDERDAVERSGVAVRPVRPALELLSGRLVSVEQREYVDGRRGRFEHHDIAFAGDADHGSWCARWKSSDDGAVGGGVHARQWRRGRARVDRDPLLLGELD